MGVYLPPVSAFWRDWSDVEPERKVAEAMAFCTASHGKPLLVIGDFNCQTASRTPTGAKLACQSQDTVADARGNQLLELCHDMKLEILNGTMAKQAQPGALTSFQPMGLTVIDYKLISSAFLSWVAVKGIVIQPVLEWSDHAYLCLVLNMPRAPIPASPELQHIPHTHSQTQEATELNCMLAVALTMTQTNESANLELYGMIRTETSPVLVYIAVACLNAGKVDAKAGCAIFWGLGSPQNTVFQIEGKQTDAWAILVGILSALTSIDGNKTVHIYTMSQYAICSFCYWVAGNATHGWGCANGGVLKLGVQYLAARNGGMDFRLVENKAWNKHMLDVYMLLTLGLKSSSIVSHALPQPP
jgi:hypothetical protein